MLIALLPSFHTHCIRLRFSLLIFAIMPLFHFLFFHYVLFSSLLIDFRHCRLAPSFSDEYYVWLHFDYHAISVFLQILPYGFFDWCYGFQMLAVFILRFHYATIFRITPRASDFIATIVNSLFLQLFRSFLRCQPDFSYATWQLLAFSAACLFTPDFTPLSRGYRSRSSPSVFATDFALISPRYAAFAATFASLMIFATGFRRISWYWLPIRHFRCISASHCFADWLIAISPLSSIFSWYSTICFRRFISLPCSPLLHCRW